jgi:5-methylcytosine-specific restriction endonuclease McrA
MPSRDSRYYKLLRSNEWLTLRARKLREQPLCEECLKKDKYRMATEVHHVIPIQRESTWNGMRQLAYDYDNLESICRECHVALHEKMGSFKRDKEDMERWQKRRVDAYINKMFGGK